MAKYRKKPIIVEAKLFEIGMEDGYTEKLVSAGKNVRGMKLEKTPYIETLEGEYPVTEGKHYIVTGVRGERYPVEKEIFEETYELVGRDATNHAIIRTEDWSHSCGDPGCCYEYGIDLYVNDILITNYFDGNEEDIQDVLKLFGITSEIECE